MVLFVHSDRWENHNVNLSRTNRCNCQTFEFLANRFHCATSISWCHKQITA